MSSNVAANGMSGEAARSSRGRLTWRLLAWFLVFSLVPLIITNALGYGRSSAIIRQLVESYLAAFAQLQAQHISDRVERQEMLLQAIVSGNEFLVAGSLRARGRPSGEMGTVATRDAVEHFLEHKLEELKNFQALYLLAPDGEILARAGERDLMLTAVPIEPGVARPFPVTSSGTIPRFRLSVSILDPAGAPLSYLAGTISLLDRDLLAVPEHIAGQVESYVVDASGRPIFISHPHGTPDYTAVLSTPLLAASNGSFDRYHSNDEGEVIGAIDSVPGLSWRYIAEVPTADAFGDLRQLALLSLLLQSLFFALLVATAWFVAWEIVVPLRRLVEATRRVARGDLGVRVVARERDELGELGRAFNEMTAELSETTARVQELHDREIERASQLATVGELASGVAHEIKNPVVGVSNGLDLVRRRIGYDPTLTPIMDEMARQLSRVQTALQDLLTFARPTTPMLAPVSGRHLLERAATLVRPAAERAGVVIEFAADPSLPTFMADEDMLHQAVVNVLMNAVQSTQSGDLVTVMIRRAGGEVEIEVKDTGRGIPESQLEDVFKPFHTTRHKGTGLGLPITREIAQRHGGGVRIASKEGSGTTVTIHIVLNTMESSVTLEEVLLR